VFVDTGNHRVRRVDPSGVVTTIAGTGTAGYSGDGGPATAAQLDTPHGVVADGAGNVYVADSPNQRIRRIDAAGTITTVAGTGAAAYNGDGRLATTAALRYPKGVEIGPDGLLYIADTVNHRVRRIEADGTITTVAGTGARGYSGDGGPATAAQFDRPRNVAFDAVGVMYVVDEGNHRVRRVGLVGIVTTLAGTGVAASTGDGGPAAAASLDLPRDVGVDATGNVFIVEEGGDRVRRVDPAGVISTFAGTGVRGYNGDDLPADTAQLRAPRGLAVTPTGGVLIADTGNHRLRLVA
jgi:streptogramin lyase